MIIGLELPGQEDLPLLLDELRLLLSNLNVETAALSTQKRDHPEPAFLVGRGKAQDLKTLTRASQCDLIVCNDTLTPQQLRNLRAATGCEVWDRPLTIMKIFERSAVTAEAKLQTELARCKYELPHIRGLGMQMSNAGAGIGTRGPGETEFERHRRKLQKLIVDKTRKLEKIRRNRQGQRKQRKRSGIPTVALVGYTNSGKTTLLKRLCGDSKLYAADRLFATLDPAVRAVRTPAGRSLLVADTVGFIRSLPPDLIAAFRATLEEACQADRLLIVLDVNDPQLLSTYEVVEETLHRIGADWQPRAAVLNKIDRADGPLTQRLVERFSREDLPVCAVSAKTGEGMCALWSLLDR